MQIQTVTFYTNQLKELEVFYSQKLGIPLLAGGTDHFELKVGTTVLRWEAGPQAAYYHYAINVPVGAIAPMMEWLKQLGIKILPFQGQEIVNFTAWKAKSVYFYDPTGNIVEFIAREEVAVPKEVAEQQQNEQWGAALLSVSEVGLPVGEVKALWAELQAIAAVPQYDGDQERFCAMGDPNGLFIIVNKNKKKWIPEDDPAIPFPLSVHFSEGNKNHILQVNANDVISIQ